MTLATPDVSLDRLRTDQVGSLLRPTWLKAQRAQVEAGRVSADAYRAAEDRAIRDVVVQQEAHGLNILTDGEFRRLNFQDSFAASVGGYGTSGADADSMAFHADRVAGGKPGQRWDPGYAGTGPGVIHRRAVTERLFIKRNLPLEEFAFLSTITDRPVKVTLIGPDRISQRFDWQDAASQARYADRWQFLDDVVRIEREIVMGLVNAGCRYVHIDEPGYTAYADAPSLAEMRSRGEDPMENLARSIVADNAVIANFPDVTIGVHLRRGNQAGMWHREGSYDAIAEQVFTETHFQRFLLEYDTERAGTFEPLRFVPRDRIVVLGLVSTKSARVESPDELLHRIEEASRFVPIEQLAISPQCGFASDIVGNPLSEDDQWRKLDVLQQVAETVWGR